MPPLFFPWEFWCRIILVIADMWVQIRRCFSGQNTAVSLWVFVARYLAWDGRLVRCTYYIVGLIYDLYTSSSSFSENLDMRNCRNDQTFFCKIWYKEAQLAWNNLFCHWKWSPKPWVFLTVDSVRVAWLQWSYENSYFQVDKLLCQQIEESIVGVL